MIRPNSPFLAVIALAISISASVVSSNDAFADSVPAIYRISDLEAGRSAQAALAEGFFADESEGANISTIVFQPEPPLPEFTLDEPSVEPTVGMGSSLFGSPASGASVLSESRRARLGSNAEIILGSEATMRATTDAGNLLGKSMSALGIGMQYRSPVTTDTRVRSARVGQFLASGSYWFPARADLDTMLSKIDSRIIDHMVVIKGPFAVRYGPGYQFVDATLVPTPRYASGYETHGSTSFDYKSNGEQLYGRQSLWGGSGNWGFRISYGHRTGNDYRTGGAPPIVDPATLLPFPGTIPASYNSRDFDVAVGWDPTEFRHLEFNYLRLDQTDVEYAGFVHDIRFLETDALELRYTDECPHYADLIEAEAWYNRTNFVGDNRGAGKIRQIPIVAINPGETDADAMSTGYRFTATWGAPSESYFSLGTDLINLTTELNESLETLPATANRLVIPDSRSTDFGIFAERGHQVNECLDLTLGARVDFISTNAENEFPDLASTLGFKRLTDAFFVDRLDREFTLWSAFLSANWQQSKNWQWTSSIGYAQRPPTLTELYAFGPFVQFIPNNLLRTNTQLLGDPRLDPEGVIEYDLALRADFPCFRGGLRGFVAFVHDYVTFDLVSGVFGVANQVGFVNTDALLSGFELYAERDFSRSITAFALANYVAGQDLTRDRPSRVRALVLPGVPRSFVPGEQEPLPNILPLEARLGVRLHEASDDPRWGIEAAARVVNRQRSVARTLFEAPAAGFTIWDLRGYWQLSPNVLLVGGVENLGDRFYREHLDSLAGRGVFQPGASYYIGSEITY